MFNASIFEKVLLGTAITSTAGFILYTMFKQPEVKKQDAFKIRQELLEKKNVKMLYSTMSFLYLYGFKSKDPDSFVTLQRILGLDAPHIVAVPISKDQYDEKYEKALMHPRFRDAMDRFKFSVKNKKLDEIVNVKDFNLKNLEMLYLIDHCISLKKCKVVYARRSSDIYKNMDQNVHVLTKEQQKMPLSQKAKIEDYTDILIQEMKPQFSFSLTPQSPFKNIVGIIEPELVEGVAQRWKQKFKQNYSHVVMEDEEVLRREEEERKKQTEMQTKFEIEQKKE